MKVLNLYAGLGGNRKLWQNVEVTAVEIDENIAKIYQDLYPQDTVIIGDAHKYLLRHYSEFDFIWSSPPCPTHSGTNFFLNAQGIIRYPDMSLWQEIILLKHFHKGKYCIENVKSYYEPLIKPQESGRHYFWANFTIPNLKYEKQIGRMNGRKIELGQTQFKIRQNNLNKLGFDLSKYNYPDKDKLLRNCVAPEIGLLILDRARNIIQSQDITQKTIFDELQINSL
jgi:DNA (cytosine-5)-methyltransferase 1